VLESSWFRGKSHCRRCN